MQVMLDKGQEDDWFSSHFILAFAVRLYLNRYDLVFEVISLVLLVAIIGAIVTAGFTRRLSS